MSIFFPDGDLVAKGARPTGAGTVRRRLSGPERQRQLLETAMVIVGEEGADRLTLGHLATSAGVSKPVAYDYFRTRSDLLIALYRWIDVERTNTFRDAMSGEPRSREETVEALSAAYIDCAADTTGEFHAVGAALAGSEEKAEVLRELARQRREHVRRGPGAPQRVVGGGADTTLHCSGRGRRGALGSAAAGDIEPARDDRDVRHDDRVSTRRGLAVRAVGA